MNSEKVVFEVKKNIKVEQVINTITKLFIQTANFYVSTGTNWRLVHRIKAQKIPWDVKQEKSVLWDGIIAFVRFRLDGGKIKRESLPKLKRKSSEAKEKRVFRVEMVSFGTFKDRII